SFWFDKGVDGFRLDAVTSYHTGDPEGNVEFTSYFCGLCRSIKPDCYIVGEAWTDRSKIAALYSSGIDSLFNFPFSGNDGIIRNTIGESISPADFVHAMVVSDESFRANNSNYIDAPFYTNHDIARSAGYYAIDEGPQTKMAYALSLLMSGNSFMYYGEEIGMKGSGKDENKRAPMYWSYDPADSDMCDGPPDMDDVMMKFPSLSEQMEDDFSLYNWFRQVIKVRNAFPVIARGRVVECPELCTDHLAVFYKECESEQKVLLIINLGPDEEVCDLSSLSKDIKLSAVLNTSKEFIEFSDNTVKMPSYSIAVITE
ncbi:MAG: alpha-amylase family glycosyl hydrolase, partial [Oscillospiraceae bacterium]|nr:alpha-amylase family glycosyl hydrolase [Oscillospiraceae bacterium]